MSLLSNHHKDAKRALFGVPMSVLIPLMAIVVYFGAVGLIGFSAAHDHGDEGHVGQSLLSP